MDSAAAVMGTNTTVAAAARGMNGEEVESSSVSITPNDLVELVRAVKFANTNAVSERCIQKFQLLWHNRTTQRMLS